MATIPPSPLLGLPVEIRLMIYDYLLFPSATTLSKDLNIKPNINFRLIDPIIEFPEWSRAVLPKYRRSKCHIHTGRFRGRTMQTTYTTTGSPNIHASILATCKKIHAEGVEVLYGSNTFAFGTCVEAISPFLDDLTAEAKGHVKRVALAKRALPYDRDFDCAEWRAATFAIATHLPNLHTLDLGVVAGKPGPGGWDEVQAWSKHDFESWTKRSWAGLEWVKDVARVRAREVNVGAIVEHCPPPMSERMSFWVEISKSVEGGFGEWVRGLISGREGDFTVGGLDGIA
jgi:hypothetical protein